MAAPALRSLVGRGDLLRVLHATGISDEANTASQLLGFERKADLVLTINTESGSALSPLVVSSSPAAQRRALQMPMWGAVRVPLARQPAAQATANIEVEAPPLTLQDWLGAPSAGGATNKPTTMPAIVPRGRALPALDRAMRRARPAGIDVAHWVQALSRRQLPAHSARTQVQRLAGQRIVVLDMHGGLAHYRHDIFWLVHTMQRSLGGLGFQVRWLVQSDEPLAGWVDVTPRPRSANPVGDPAPAPAQMQAWQAPPPDAQVLLVSDLGLATRSGAAGAPRLPAPWVRWLQCIKSRGANVQVWSPVPLQAGGVQPEHAALPVVHWSAASSLRPHALARGALHANPQRLELAQQLLARLAFCASIDAHLLRTLRLAMGACALDAGLEQLAWASPDLSRGAATRRMQVSKLGHHRNEFAALPAPVQQQVQRLASAHYARFSQPLQHMHTVAWASRVSNAAASEAQADVRAAQQFVARLSQAPGTGGVSAVEAGLFLHTWLQHADPVEQRHQTALRTDLNAALLALQPPAAASLQVAAGVSHAQLASRLLPGATPKPHWLVQDAASGRLLLSPLLLSSGQSPLLFEALMLASVDIETEMQPTRQWVQLDGIHAFTLPSFSNYAVLRGAEQDVHIAQVERPLGVDAWHRNVDGLHLQVSAFGARHWQAAPADVQLRLHRDGAKPPHLRVEVTAKLVDREALSFGVEPEHGAFLDLQVKAITQRLRRISPGTFLMGSPNNEGDSDEHPQHPVTISRAFWLADTPCTQALWLAVMGGKNPSRFKDRNDSADRPVEQVTWDDTKLFLQRLQAHLPPECEAFLPSEAQWEYACRAGTTTPYFWGDKPDSQRANMGEALKQTSPVKSYKPNPWGLYDMHGNVWEWCGDSWRTYLDRPEVDPSGGDNVDTRVLRGGSWGARAGGARSADRNHDHRGGARHFTGFRLALRSTSPDQPGLVGPGGPGVFAAGGSPAPAEPGRSFLSRLLKRKS